MLSDLEHPSFPPAPGIWQRIPASLVTLSLFHWWALLFCFFPRPQAPEYPFSISMQPSVHFSSFTPVQALGSGWATKSCWGPLSPAGSHIRCLKQERGSAAAVEYLEASWHLSSCAFEPQFLSQPPFLFLCMVPAVAHVHMGLMSGVHLVAQTEARAP